MFRKFCFFLLIPMLGYSQSLTVSVESRTAGNQYTTIGLDRQNVTFSNSSISFPATGATFGDYLDYAVTPDYSNISILKNTMQGARAFILNTEADTLISYNTISVDYSDPSLSIYTVNAGGILLQNNIANFTLYNSLGAIKTSGSSSSQSKQGEAISEVAMDPAGKTILIYTPKIKQNNGFGSQAQVLKENNSTRNIFYSSERHIKYATVSDNGQFVALITAREGTSDQVVILDRYGNEIGSITSDEELTGANFTENNRQILLHSSRRALVYSTLSGKRFGSTSFRSPLVMARYFADDHTIVGLTGSKVPNTDIYRDIEFHAINLEQREIARREMDGALGTSPKIDMQFYRTGAGRYQLRGTNKIVNLRASF